MLSIKSRSEFSRVVETNPYVVIYAYTPAFPDSLLVLEQLKVVAPGVLFIRLDLASSAEFRELQKDLAIARFPSILFSAHGEIKELIVGDNSERIFSALVKWYKTVYTCE